MSLSRKNRRLLLFDLDGTLIDVFAYHHTSFGTTMRLAWGIERMPPEVNPWGLSQVETMRRACLASDISDAAFKEQVDEAQRTLTKEMVALLPDDLGENVLPGVFPLLDKLVAQEVHIGLVTGSLGPTASVLLERSGLSPYFPVAAFGHEGTHRETLVRLAVERAVEEYGLDVAHIDLVTIGDAPPDIEAGKACGARTVGVATGGISVEELKKYDPDVILENLEDVQRAYDAIVV